MYLFYLFILSISCFSEESRLICIIGCLYQILIYWLLSLLNVSRTLSFLILHLILHFSWPSGGEPMHAQLLVATTESSYKFVVRIAGLPPIVSLP